LEISNFQKLGLHILLRNSNDDFKKHLGQAGAIRGLCVKGLDIAYKLRSDLNTPERQAFASLLKILFELTKVTRSIWEVSKQKIC
jgi:hypothetical protein